MFVIVTIDKINVLLINGLVRGEWLTSVIVIILTTTIKQPLIVINKHHHFTIINPQMINHPNRNQPSSSTINQPLIVIFTNPSPTTNTNHFPHPSWHRTNHRPSFRALLSSLRGTSPKIAAVSATSSKRGQLAPCDGLENGWGLVVDGWFMVVEASWLATVGELLVDGYMSMVGSWLWILGSWLAKGWLMINWGETVTVNCWLMVTWWSNGDKMMIHDGW